MRHPYQDRPDHQFWRRDPGLSESDAFDPVVAAPFRLTRSCKVVTAGSCFAQHVARHLTESGYNHLITEDAHPAIRPELRDAHHYGLFSARYGNVYTARQLKQLVERAYGVFTPRAAAWAAPDGPTLVDPFRPQIQPGGFLHEAELEADRAHHLACVRRAFEEMDVFVFTLGLTEGWADPRDGAVFPLAPGVAGGVHGADPADFVNFDESDTSQDLIAALRLIRDRNPEVRFILTVSPVPLNATYVPRHVSVSTFWSKAVLRVAAERACKTLAACCYFPSYEVITSPQTRSRYFAEDCREVRPEGVAHAMRLFFRHYGEAGAPLPAHLHGGASRPRPARRTDPHAAEMERTMQILCDEEAIGKD